MIAFILALPARLKLWAAAAFGVLMLGLGIYRKGRADNQAKHTANEAKAYRNSVEDVTDEKASIDPADVIRDRMRQRAKR